ncbi:MAG TPA: family 16 glycoside hydrolase [Pirellulales bacterium]|nr:family 16 glycoside hydrolase [Pirellulales bacterium]
MNPCRMCAVLVMLIGGLRSAFAAADEAEGFTPMFNGQDLAGWVNVNCAPGTFFVKGEEVITNGNPTGFLRTARQYENFILELDWMHVNTSEVGNSGLFVWGDALPAVGTPYTRGIEVQVLVNLEYKDPKTGAITATSQGDVFSIWGAKCTPDRPHPLGWERCLPSENRAKGGGEWNHYKVVANDGTIKLAVNGTEVSGVSNCSPRKGYLALESEGAECHFRNVKIQELPTTNPQPAEIAKLDEGHTSLFDGLTLDGWEFWTPPGYSSDHGWKAAGGRLTAVGTDFLSTKKEFGPCELIFDWMLPADAENPQCTVSVGGQKRTVQLPQGTKPGSWQRHTLKVEKVAGLAAIQILPAPGLELMNLFVRESKSK